MTTALVTGASSGLGRELAILFAADGIDVVAVSSERSAVQLNELADELRARHGIRVDPITMDLSRPGAGAELVDRVDELGVDVEYLVNNAGVGILGGTDCLNPYVFPGFSLHDELDFLVAAGLGPRQALQTVTRDAAAFLGRADTAGTITPGKVADLVLLDADPLADIRAVRRIDTVVTGGRVLDRTTLDQMLADAEAAANRPGGTANARSVRLPVHGCC